MKSYNINDESIIKNIRKQLQAVQTEFEDSYQNTKNNLYKKKERSSNFNITLFGRTKVGKSTLMEILTHGDGSHMGDGGQRTTRDVRSYEWRGMSVTDVPGIDAFGGQEDDSKAEEAATYADLILFMITAGQPESTEADWMVKLKKMDKPILCICNYKQSLGVGTDDFRLKRMLSDPNKVEERMNIEELSQQFNKFLHDQLPYEHVEFLVTHLLAKFYSQQSEYKQYKDSLEKISRFSKIEQSIINEVLTNGVLHRKKCYLSIIDAPLYHQMMQLFKFSAESYSQFRIIQDKLSMFNEWCEDFNTNRKNRLLNDVTSVFNKLRNAVPGFVEAHIEDSDVSKAWQKRTEEFHIGEDIQKLAETVHASLDQKISALFSELNTEMKFSLKFNAEKELGNYQFTNWKRVWNWTGAIASAGLGITAIALACGPLGWAALAVGGIFSFFSWLADSRESKLRERRSELSKKLYESINDAEKKSKQKLLRWFKSNIISVEDNVSNKLSLIGKSMLSLSCGERELALGYGKNHKDITKMVIANIFFAMNVPMTELDRIVCAARVPGRRTTLVIKGEDNLPFNLKDLSTRLGSNEWIDVIKLHTNATLEVQLRYLLNHYGFSVKPIIKKVNRDTQTVVYLHDNNYGQKELDSLVIIQQILNIHIILR